MELKEKLAILEDMMELETGSLAPETSLVDLEEWDSLSALSFVVMLGDEFQRKISGQEIRSFETVQDMLNVMKKDD